MMRATLLWLTLVGSLTAAAGQTERLEANKRVAESEDIYELEMGIMFARLARASQPRKAQGIVIPDLNSVLADDYTRIDARGQVITKQAELEQSRRATLSQPCRGRLGNIQIIRLENVVVVKSVISVESCDGSSFEPPGRYRVTSIYANRQGRWQLLSSQWTGASG